MRGLQHDQRYQSRSPHCILQCKKRKQKNTNFHSFCSLTHLYEPGIPSINDRRNDRSIYWYDARLPLRGYCH